METVLVTGGTGFVASWCIAELLQQGFAVRTTVRDLGRGEAVRAVVGKVTDIGQLSFAVADLTRDAGWAEAMTGIDYVLHVASPLGFELPRDRMALVVPARDGTLRVLKAAVAARVKRVVMTSAAATARPRLDSGLTSDETLWADENDPQFDAYRVSKILAEKAAWEFMRSKGGSTEFATVLPGAVFGPVLSADNLGSVKIIADLIDGRPARMPRLGFWVVDVRDLAHAHVLAMTNPGAAGERFIAAGEFLWMEEMAARLREALGERGNRVPSRRLPSWVVPLLVPFMPVLKTLAPLVGRKFMLTTAKARRVLGWTSRPAAVTLADCAESLLEARGTRDASRR